MTAPIDDATVERVARAIYNDSYTQYDTCSERHWKETSETQRQFCRGQTHAAIAALQSLGWRAPIKEGYEIRRINEWDRKTS